MLTIIATSRESDRLSRQQILRLQRATILQGLKRQHSIAKKNMHCLESSWNYSAVIRKAAFYWLKMASNASNYSAVTKKAAFYWLKMASNYSAAIKKPALYCLEKIKRCLQPWSWLRGAFVSFNAIHLPVSNVLEAVCSRGRRVGRVVFSVIQHSILMQARCNHHSELIGCKQASRNNHKCGQGDWFQHKHYTLFTLRPC